MTPADRERVTTPAQEPEVARRERPVLITGGAGFIGCNVANRLLGGGQRVILYDNLSRAGVHRTSRGSASRTASGSRS
jgi:CDP-paratose 2-epimerase